MNYAPILLITINNTLRISGVLPVVNLSVAYSATLKGYGGVEPYTWFLSSGTLPAGITATQDTNGDFVFSGTTTEPGRFALTVTLRDSGGRSVSQSYVLIVEALQLTITGTPPNAAVGDPYSYTYDIDGGVPPYYFFTMVGGGFGPIPSGLTFTADSNGDPVLYGTPDTFGTYTFKIGVNDSQSPAAFTYVVNTMSVVTSPLVVTGAFTDTPVGDPLDGSPLAISGGVPPYGLSGSPYSGTRPAGVTISVSGTDLVATGNTTTQATYTWTERVTSSDAQHYDVPCSIDVTAATDPYWANVVALLHFDGANGGTTFTDETGRTWTPNTGVTTSTVEKKFGTASGLFNGSTGYLDAASSSDFAFGTGDFTIEMFIYTNVAGGYMVDIGTNGIVIQTHSFSPIKVRVYTVGTGIAGTLYTGAGFSDNTWTHVALVRSGSSLSLYIDGTLGATQTTSQNFSSSVAPHIGRYGGGGQPRYNGYMDELRITKGVARYTANFTPPTAPFPNS